MAINTQKVLLGGLAAAVVLNVVDYIVYDHVLATRMTAAADAFKPGLGAQMMSGNAIVAYVLTDLVIGMLLVWTYAAIRPRFGPGMRTATYAALLFWLLGFLSAMGSMQTGMMSAKLWGTTMVVLLGNLLIAAWVGARIYTEESATA
jgi:hypothetical protein